MQIQMYHVKIVVYYSFGNYNNHMIPANILRWAARNSEVLWHSTSQYS